MSEVITTGPVRFTVTAAFSAITLGEEGIQRASVAFDNMIQEMVDTTNEDFNRLREIASRPIDEVSSAHAARLTYEAAAQELKEVMGRTKTLSTFSDKIGSALALKNSSLGNHVTANEWELLKKHNCDQSVFQDMLKNASDKLTASHFDYAIKVIKEVSLQQGFIEPLQFDIKNGMGEVKLADVDGRAVMAKIGSTYEGTSIELDLAGYGNGQCHVVMDDLIKGLEEHGIFIDSAKRTSHYKREGVLKNGNKSPHVKQNEVTPAEERAKRQSEKRRRSHQSQKQKV